MSTNFPTSLDNSTSLPYPSALSKRNSPSLAGLSDNQNDAVIATQTKIGTGAATPVANRLFTGTGTGTSDWSKVSPTGTIVGTTDSQTLTNKILTSPTINAPIITNASITADSITGFTTSNTGSIYGMAVSAGSLSITGTLAISSTISVTGASTLTGTVNTVGQLSIQTGTAPPAAGANTAGIKLSSTANLGIFYGSGAPTFTAAQGAIYLRTDGNSTSTRLYVNTTGSTTWTNFTSGA